MRGESATQSGSSTLSNPHAAQLLRIIGRRGNWTIDDLMHESAIRYTELQHALFLLELDGRIRRRSGLIDPV